jgi:predicted ABC-type ATPase
VYGWNASEDVAALARDEAVLAGKNARLKLELEEGGFEVERESIRRRLARTLVQLGMKIDPMVGEEISEEA